MKKVLILIAIVVVAPLAVMAQQVPMFTNYFYNRFMNNPAMAGYTGCGQIFATHRHQWNIPGAPRTQSLSIDAPLNNTNAGIGLGLYRDQAGAFTPIGGQFAYRYRVNLDNGHNVSLGLGLGFLNMNVNGDFDARHSEDPDVVRRAQNRTGFDATFGINYNFKSLNIGLTVPQVLGGDIAYEGFNALDEVQYQMARQFRAMIDYTFKLGSNGDWGLQPLFLTRITPGSPFQFDGGLRALWRETVWFGAMYRHGYAINAFAGANISKSFILGYAYDYGFSNEITRNSHEVTVGYQFCGSKEIEKLKKKVDEVDAKTEENKKKADELDKKVKENKDNIDGNDKDIDGLRKMKDDIDENEKEIEELKKQIKDLESLKASISRGDNIVGSSLSLKNVYFQTNKWNITSPYDNELDDLATILKDNASMQMEVSGYADTRGNSEYNNYLSRKRAVAVKDYLISKGVKASQLTLRSYGEDESTSLDEARRVEFKVLAQ